MHTLRLPTLHGLLLSLVLIPSPLSAQRFIARNPAAAKPAIVSTDSADRLSQLVGNMLLSAKNDNRDGLRAQIAALEIPNYRNWFTRTYGPERGQSWAASYCTSLAQHETELADLFTQLAQQPGSLSVRKLDASQHDPLTPALDEYLVTWTPSASAATSHDVENIGYFYFIDGAFHLDSSLPFPLVHEPASPLRIAVQPLVMVSPQYPPEARAQSIEGTVILTVILRKDGSVTALNLAEGNPILYSAAAQAVRRWRCRPYLLNGQPVQIRTRIDITFRLDR